MTLNVGKLFKVDYSVMKVENIKQKKHKFCAKMDEKRVKMRKEYEYNAEGFEKENHV